MFVYQAPEFRREVEELGLSEAIEKLTDWLEREAHTPAQLAGRLDPLVPYWKERVGKNRVVGLVRTVEGRDVFCFLAAFQRKDTDYEAFCDEPREWGATALEQRATARDVSRWLRLELAKLDREAAERQRAPRLPDSYAPWLDPAAAKLPGWEEEESFVFESPLWNQRMSQQRYRDYWADFFATIEDAAGEERSDDQPMPGVEIAADPTAGNAHVVLARLRLANPDANVLYLVAPFLDRPSKEEVTETVEDLAPNLPSLVERSESEGLHQDDAARLASRTYPTLLLADREAWRELEFQEDEGSLALSVEEEGLLEDVYTLGGEKGLPLFINGRAGSGKSTMLTYLFAGYCFNKQALDLSGEPLYLTYNEELLGVARDNVKALLRAAGTRHEALSGDSATASAIEPDAVDGWFASFRRFLLRRLPEEVRERFRHDRHVSFHYFKEAFLGGEGRLAPLRMAEATRWSPELCWYVIRTLIKGYQSGEPMTPDDYGEIPRRDRVIDHETFAEIHQVVWERWYEKQTRFGEFWDDQDLVAAALEHWDPEFDRQAVTTVFCDEAQDFTRQEIRFLLRLSMLSRHDLGSTYVGALPFAFAGDPLQTLNPTGFRWASVQAAFHDELLAPLRGSAQVDLSMTELANNYRSCKPIVELVNGIQLWRCTLFDLSGVQPQLPWDERETTVPRKFILGENLDRADLDAAARDTTMLLPCEEGQELEFVRNDPDLSGLPAFEQALADGRRPKNVYSAILAKGLDFERVIVYKFGAHAPAGLWEAQGENTRGRFRAEYFLNKLYVGASRARTHLFVVDDRGGDEALWGRWASDDDVSAVLDRYDGRVPWRERVRPLPLAPPAAAREMIEEDRQSLAEHLEASGRQSGEPEYLRSAAGYYEELEEADAAERCQALALKFEGRLVEAGHRFMGCGRVDEAWDCWWESRAWQELQGWFEAASPRSAEVHRREQPLVACLVGPIDDHGLLIEFARTVVGAVDEQASLRWLEDVWSDIAPALTARVDVAAEQAERTRLESLGHDLSALADAGFDAARSLAGRCFFAADQPGLAARAWEDARETDHRDYLLAKAATTAAPRKLRFLQRAGAHDQIVDAWHEAHEPGEREWLEHVGPALEQAQDHARACRAFLELEDVDGALRCFRRMSPLHQDFTRDLDDLTRLLVDADVLEDHTPAVEALARLLRGHRGNIGTERLLDLLSTALHEIVESSLASAHAAELPAPPPGLASLVQLVTTTEGWRERVDPLLVGAAYEVVGVHVETLRFYEQLVDDPDLGSVARRRWLAVKQLQVEHERSSRGNVAAAERLRRQRARRAHDWGFREDVELPRLPQVPRTAEEGGRSRRDESAPGATPRHRAGSLQFVLSREGATIGIIDQESAMTAQVDLAGRSVQLPDGRTVGGGDRVDFVFGDGYEVTILFEAGRLTVSNPEEAIDDEWRFWDTA